jgi:bacillithiol biosynthesis cysteine-adding enzyme BshC
MQINFGDIPGQYNLFLDYLYEFENVKKFYKHDFRNKDEYLKLFKSISETTREFRGDIPKIIHSQYEGFTPSQKTKLNIDSLKEKNTLAVVTGQQLGILGGPLYTFYKIITAIKLSEHLKERYDAYNFVPIFWLEGDDHDFEEVRSIGILNDVNELTKIFYNDEDLDDETRSSVGYLNIKDSISSFFDNLDKNLRDTEFKPEFLKKLKDIYSNGKSFKQSFKELILWFFDKYGLIIFDPQDVIIKNLLKPVFKKEINDFRLHTEKLVQVSATLEELYHAQVKVRPVSLFYSTEDGRFLIEPVENEFRLRRKRKKFTQEEIIDEINNRPENFSPNVLLRPICQDYLLPTAFYIGGPGEISYFAQITPLYDFYKINQPIIYPRASATIYEKNLENLFEKHNLQFEDVFSNSDELKTRVINSISKYSVDDIFGESNNQIEHVLDRLKEKLFEFDKTIADSTGKYRQKILNYLDELKGKAIEAQKKRHEITLRQIDKLTNSLFPNNTLQERELNFVYFYNKYGEKFIERLFEELKINTFDHQVIQY